MMSLRYALPLTLSLALGVAEASALSYEMELHFLVLPRSTSLSPERLSDGEELLRAWVEAHGPEGPGGEDVEREKERRYSGLPRRFVSPAGNTYERYLPEERRKGPYQPPFYPSLWIERTATAFYRSSSGRLALGVEGRSTGWVREIARVQHMAEEEGFRGGAVRMIRLLASRLYGEQEPETVDAALEVFMRGLRRRRLGHLEWNNDGVENFLYHVRSMNTSASTFTWDDAEERRELGERALELLGTRTAWIQEGYLTAGLSAHERQLLPWKLRQQLQEEPAGDLLGMGE